MQNAQPEGPLWTFWDYERNRWPLDKGMRLDHFLLSPTARDRLVHGGVDRWVRGEENASDHAPAWIVLRRLLPVRCLACDAMGLPLSPRRLVLSGGRQPVPAEPP